MCEGPAIWRLDIKSQKGNGDNPVTLFDGTFYVFDFNFISKCKDMGLKIHSNPMWSLSVIRGLYQNQIEVHRLGFPSEDYAMYVLLRCFHAI